MVTMTKLTRGSDLLKHTQNKLKMAVIRLTGETGDVYTTGGVSLSSYFTNINISTPLGAILLGTSLGNCFSLFDATNKKLLLFDKWNGTGGVFGEVTNNTSIASETFDILIFGY